MWDSFRSSLPFALQHHINGNAVYNLSHPLLPLMLDQLEEETSQPLHAVPYEGHRATREHVLVVHLSFWKIYRTTVGILPWVSSTNISPRNDSEYLST